MHMVCWASGKDVNHGLCAVVNSTLGELIAAYMLACTDATNPAPSVLRYGSRAHGLGPRDRDPSEDHSLTSDIYGYRASGARSLCMGHQAATGQLRPFRTESEFFGAADKAADLEGCESPYRQLPGFGRLAYPQHGAGNQPCYGRT